MSMLTTIQRFCGAVGLSRPATVLGSNDPKVLQMLAILEEEGSDLSGRGAWEALTNEAVHTTIAAENQGSMATIASNGFRYILNDTIWDRTLRLPVWGPVGDTDWQTLKAMVVTGPRTQYRIRGGNLLANPIPAAGSVWAFEYISWNWITDGAGENPKRHFTADSDLILLPEEIVQLGLKWRWKKEKGLEYAEDFRTYEMQVKDALGHDGGKKTLNMGEDGRSANPMVYIPAGNWITP